MLALRGGAFDNEYALELTIAHHQELQESYLDEFDSEIPRYQLLQEWGIELKQLGQLMYEQHHPQANEVLEDTVHLFEGTQKQRSVGSLG